MFCGWDIAEWIDDCEASPGIDLVSSLKWSSEDALAWIELSGSSFPMASSSWMSS